MDQKDENPFKMKYRDGVFSQGLQTHSHGKLFFLGLISLGLSSVGPFSLFAPVPLSIAFLLYGKMKALIMGLFYLLVVVSIPLLAEGVTDFWVFAGIFFTSLVYSYLLSGIIFKKEEPTKGFLRIGFSVILFVAMSVVAIEMVSETSLVQQLESWVQSSVSSFKTHPDYKQIIASGEQGRWLQDFMDNPERIVKNILYWAPSWFFVGTFFSFWVCLLMVLRNGLIWKGTVSYPYSTRQFINFRVPYVFVWPLIVGLTLYVFSDNIGGEVPEVLGLNLLYCLGVFYFFQGIGVYLGLLDFLQIRGIIRTFFVVTTTLMAWRLVVVAGVFDVWFNFKKYFKKKKDKGDQS